MDAGGNKALFNFLKDYILEQRLARFNEVIANRTRHFTMVLENLYQPHNASAVLRTADCLGVQDIHIIENEHKYHVNPDVALGAAKWLTLHKYKGLPNNTPACYDALRAKGYRIVATTPHTNASTLYNLPVDKPFALVFGTELKGLTNYALDNADEYVAIPLYGFTESFNISVTAALFMHYYSQKLRDLNLPWQLTEAENDEILVNWAKGSIRESKKLVEYYYTNLAKAQ